MDSHSDNIRTSEAPAAEMPQDEFEKDIEPVGKITYPNGKEYVCNSNEDFLLMLDKALYDESVNSFDDLKIEIYRDEEGELKREVGFIKNFMEINQEIFLENNGEDLEGTYSAVSFFPYEKETFFEFESDNYGYTPEVGHVVTDKDKTVLAENVHNREEAIEAIKARKEAAIEDVKHFITSAADSREKSADNKLLFVLNAVRESKQDKIDSINKKNTAILKKIAGLEARIESLQAKSDRLRMTNETLKAFFGEKPPKPIQAIIDSNEKRAKKLSDRSVLKCNLRISEQVDKVTQNNQRIEKAQCTVDKMNSLDKLIKSFAIVDGVERRKAFSEAMHGLHYASSRAVGFKLNKCENRISELKNQYQSAAVADKFAIGEKINRLTEKKDDLNAKLKRYSEVDTFIGKPDTALDKAVSIAENEVKLYSQSLENPEAENKIDSISVFPEKLTASCCEAISESEREQPARQSDITEIKENISEINDALKSIKEHISGSDEISSSEREQGTSGRSMPQNSPTENEAAKSVQSTHDILGNTNYNSIANKFYVNLTPEKAREVSKILDANGIKHSGRIYSEKEAKITLDKADVKAYKRLTSTREQEKSEKKHEQAVKHDEPKRSQTNHKKHSGPEL